MGNIPDMKGVFIACLALAAVLGWAAIELVLWLFSSISITIL